MLLVRAVDPYERFAWHLLRPKTDVEITLAVRRPGPDAS